MKCVLDIGNCGPDHAAIRAMIETHFSARVDQAHSLDDTREKLRERRYDLLLVNRKLDCDYSDGLSVIEKLKQEPDFATLPMMLITNFAAHQKLACEVGAVPGFGKLALNEAATLERLRPYLAD